MNLTPSIIVWAGLAIVQTGCMAALKSVANIIFIEKRRS